MQSRKISKQQFIELLDNIESAPGEWVTVYLSPASLSTHHDRPVLSSRVEPRLLAAAAIIQDEQSQRAALRSGTGLVLFLGDEATYAIIPPFPVSRDEVKLGRPDTTSLRAALQRNRRTLLLLVTWNAYVLALFEAEQMLRYKKGTGHIHPPHKKGGSSQARFARRTENQRAEFLRRVGGHIDTLFGAESVDRIFFGGNRLILRPLTTECRYLRDHRDILAPRTLLVERAVLDSVPAAIADAFSAVVLTP